MIACESFAYPFNPKVKHKAAQEALVRVLLIYTVTQQRNSEMTDYMQVEMLEFTLQLRLRQRVSFSLWGNIDTEHLAKSRNRFKHGRAE